MDQKKTQKFFRAPQDILRDTARKATSQIKSATEPYLPKQPQPTQHPEPVKQDLSESAKIHQEKRWVDQELKKLDPPKAEPKPKAPAYATPTAINRVDTKVTALQAPSYATPTAINRADTQMTTPKAPKVEPVFTPTQFNRMDAETVYQGLMADRDKVSTVATHYQTGAGDMKTVMDTLAELQDKYGVTGADFAAYANGDQEGAVRQLYDRLPAPRKAGPGFWSRLGAMASGAGKASGAAFANALTDLYRGGQGGRDRENRELLEQYERDLEQAKRGLAQAKDAELEEPGKWTRDVKSWQNLVDVCQLKYDAMAKVVNEGVQKKATDAAHGWADDIQASAQEDLERAKEGLGKLGQATVDAGATVVQSGTDAVLGLLLGVPSLIPFVARAYGAASQKARQDGADELGQNAYGVAIAATELITEKLFGLALPFYGDGAMDDAVKRGISKAVTRFAKTELGQRALKGVLTLGLGGAGEGLEEFIADWAQWQMPRIYGGDVASAEETAANSLYDFFVGTIAGMMGETVNPATYRYETVTPGETTSTTAVAPSSVHHVLDLVQQADAMAKAEWKNPDWVPQEIRDAMKGWTDLNVASAKRNALGDLLGYPRDFQKDIAVFLDKVISDAEDIARWESMPPDVRQHFQPDLKEKKESLQWLEDRLAKREEPKDTTGSVKEEFTEEQGDNTPQSHSDKKLTDDTKLRLAAEAPIRKAIQGGDYPLTINPEKQAPHMLGTAIPGKSVITISQEELQVIVNEKAGSGEIKFQKGSFIWKHQEIIDAGKEIGYTVNLEGVIIKTRYIKIHYRKTGVHVVPYSGGMNK